MKLITKIKAVAKLRTKKEVLFHKIRLLDNEERALIKEIAPFCPHQDYTEFQWEHDNGYGTQTKRAAKRCTLCSAENKYGVWYPPV
jgi:hypothetical protein